MSKFTYLRAAALMSLLLLGHLTHAQSTPAEQAAPRPAQAAVAAAEPGTAVQPEELVRYFTRELSLLPHQSVALRRVLLDARAKSLATAAAPASPLDTLRPLLNAQQLTRLGQLQGSPELRRLTAAR